MKVNLDTVIEDLKELPFLSDFQYRKSSPRRFYIKDKERTLFIEFRACNEGGLLFLEPVYGVKYNVLHKWFQKFSKRSINDQRGTCSFAFLGRQIDKHQDGFYYFDCEGKDYREEFAKLSRDLQENIKYLYARYGSLESCYKTEILPYLRGEEQLPDSGVEWIFEDLALCKLVSPEDYPAFKRMVMERVDWLKSRGEPNVSRYDNEMEDILHYLETTDITNIKRERRTHQDAAQDTPSKPLPDKNIKKMSGKEYEKMQADVRRSVGRKYGFRQSSYCNFKVENGYFFNIDFVAYASLKVKPMYADDLWWDIFDMPDNKNEPLSLRALGAFAVNAQNLVKYDIPESYDREELEGQYERLFKNASEVIADFLIQNPDADRFYPSEEMMNRRSYDMLNLLALIRNGRESEALEIAAEALKNDRSCGMIRSKDGRDIDGFEFIINWCKRLKTARRFAWLLFNKEKR